ncbi:hypothetical protein ACFXJJ_23690 [Streptomyces sp. NPDC059233]
MIKRRRGRRRGIWAIVLLVAGSLLVARRRQRKAPVPAGVRPTA